MIYNRVLTSAESAQNYAAYRGRYGIWVFHITPQL
jgi:hypothetical protein